MAIVGTPFHGLDEYGHVRIRAKAAITKGHFVRTGTNGVQAAGDGTTCFGIAEDAATAAGDNIVVATRGVWKVQNAAAYNPDQGDAVYLASSSTVDAGSATNLQAGVTVYADPACAGTSYIYLTPAEATYFAHA